jgi:hypothetical protein
MNTDTPMRIQAAKEKTNFSLSLKLKSAPLKGSKRYARLDITKSGLSKPVGKPKYLEATAKPKETLKQEKLSP